MAMESEETNVNAGDWVVLKTTEEDTKKTKKELILVSKVIAGKTIKMFYTIDEKGYKVLKHSKVYRLATQAEIKKEKLRGLFKKEKSKFNFD